MKMGEDEIGGRSATEIKREHVNGLRLVDCVDYIAFQSIASRPWR